MVDQLMKHADGAGVYATSRINNGPMHSALTAHGGFVREGSEYPSQQGDVPLRLFVHWFCRGIAEIVAAGLIE